MAAVAAAARPQLALGEEAATTDVATSVAVASPIDPCAQLMAYKLELQDSWSDDELRDALSSRLLLSSGERAVLIDRLVRARANAAAVPVSPLAPPPPAPAALQPVADMSYRALQAYCVRLQLPAKGKRAALAARVTASREAAAALLLSRSSPLVVSNAVPALDTAPSAIDSVAVMTSDPDSDSSGSGDETDSNETMAADVKREVLKKLLSFVSFVDRAYTDRRRHALRRWRLKTTMLRPPPPPPPPPPPLPPPAATASAAAVPVVAPAAPTAAAAASSMPAVVPPSAPRSRRDRAQRLMIAALAELSALTTEDIVREAHMISRVPPGLQAPYLKCQRIVEKAIKRFDKTWDIPALSDKRLDAARTGTGVLLASFQQWLMWSPSTLSRTPSDKALTDLLRPRLAMFNRYDFMSLQEAFVAHSAEVHDERRASKKVLAPVPSLLKQVRSATEHGSVGEWSKCLQTLESPGAAHRDAFGRQQFVRKIAQLGDPVGATQTPLVSLSRTDPVLQHLEEEAIRSHGEPTPSGHRRARAHFEDFVAYLRAIPPHTASDATHVSIDWFKGLLYASVESRGEQAGINGPLGYAFNLVKRVAEGRIPERGKELLFVSSGMILPKIDGGWRPICITGVWRKLASGTLLRPHRAKIVAACEKVLQFGNSKDGCATVGHALRAHLEHDPTKAVGQLDATNAFSSMSRTCVIAGLREVAPELIPFVLDVYARENDIMFWRDDQDEAWNLVKMALGVAQGCTLGSILFCIGLIPYVRQMRDEFGLDEPDATAHMLLICDDVFIVAHPDIVLKMTRRWDQLVGSGTLSFAPPGVSGLLARAHFEGPMLTMNAAKSHTWSPTEFSSAVKREFVDYGFKPTNIHPPTEGLRVVGVYIGADEWVENTLREYIEQRVAAYHRADAVACVDRLLTYQLFTHCYVQRVTHLSRTHKPALLAKALRYFDVNTTAAAQHCLRLGALPHDAQIRASLPCRYAGIAIRSTLRAMNSAYVAGFGAAVKTCAFMDDAALGPHAATFLTDETAVATLPSFAAWRNAADFALLQGADSLAEPHARILKRICTKGGQHILVDEIERKLCADMMSWPDELDPDNAKAAVARRARIYSGGGLKHTAGALMSSTSRINRALPLALRDSFCSFLLEMQLDLELSLGRPLRAVSQCPLCGIDLSGDKRGHHILSCSKSGQFMRNERHQRCVFAYSDLLTSVGSVHTLGPRGVGMPVDEKSGKAPDIYELDVHMHGLPVAADFRVVTCCSQSESAHAVNKRAVSWPEKFPERCPAALFKPERVKKRKYDPLCHRNGWTFMPLIHSDIGGAGGPETMRHVRAIARSCRATCDPWMFWVRFRQIGTMVSLGTFNLARAIRADIVRAAGLNVRDAAAHDRSRLQPSAVESCNEDDLSILSDLPLAYRTAWFNPEVTGQEHAALLRTRMGEAFAALVAASGVAARTPQRSDAAFAAALRATLRAAASKPPSGKAASTAASAQPQPVSLPAPSAAPSQNPLAPVAMPMILQPNNKNSLASNGVSASRPSGGPLGVGKVVAVAAALPKLPGSVVGSPLLPVSLNPSPALSSAPPDLGAPVDLSLSPSGALLTPGSLSALLARSSSTSCAVRDRRSHRPLRPAARTASRSDNAVWRTASPGHRRRALRRIVKRHQHRDAANAAFSGASRCRYAVDCLSVHAADEISLERSVRVSALAAGSATPCSARVLQPLTVSFSPSLEFEASAAAAALQDVPPVEADVFEELMDDDSAFFEEPVAAIVERMASLSHGRDD